MIYGNKNSAYIIAVLKNFLSTSASRGLAVSFSFWPIHVARSFLIKTGLLGISTKSTNSGSLANGLAVCETSLIHQFATHLVGNVVKVAYYSF